MEKLFGNDLLGKSRMEDFLRKHFRNDFWLECITAFTCNHAGLAHNGKRAERQKWENAQNWIGNEETWPKTPEQKEKGGSFFTYSWSFFCLQLSFFAYSPLRSLLDALSHSKQKAPTVSRKAKTVSNKAPTVSKKAKIVNCK